jgi:uncharacterized protein (DUF1015 family)
LVDIRPFKAITYTPKAGDIANLIAQPYDKIDAEMQRQYYALSPYHYCRLILPLEPNKYKVANERITKWLKEGIMAKETQPAIYISRQEFTLFNKRCYRLGIIAASRLYSYSENVIFPHECTFKEPKADRLNMLRNVQKDLEPVFLMYKDPNNETIDFINEITTQKPFIHVIDSLMVEHTIWKVTDPEKILHLQKIFSSKSMVITDGHHRYESAVAYRDEMRSKGYLDADAAFNFHMCYIVPLQDGLVVLPTHRLLKNYNLSNPVLDALKRFFDVYEIESTVSAIDSFLACHVGDHAFCVYDGSRVFGLLLKSNDEVYAFVNANVSKETKIFDVVILRDIVFKHILNACSLCIDNTIFYARWTKEAFDKVNRGEACLAFFVNPISAETVVDAALQHEVLPEKSTDFYPKLVSGLVLMDISLSEKL